MQATTCLHDGVTKAILQEAYPVFHHSVAFHPTDRVFNTNSDGCNRTISRFLLWREFTSTRFFLRLDDRDPLTCIALEPHILIETTATWEGIAFQIRQAFIILLPFIGGTQEANVTGRIDHEEIFDRVALLLATIVFLLVLEIFGALDRSLRTIMPKRGVVDSSFDCLVVRRVANSSAVRAGSRSW
jgi:hypothetical protein